MNTSKTRKRRTKKRTKKMEKNYKERSSTKWRFLQHNGPVFPSPYKPLPAEVSFKYDEKPLKLQNESEEVMTFYAKILNDDCAKKKLFIKNFFEDWRKAMTPKERDLIKDFNLCDFREVHEYFVKKVSGKESAFRNNDLTKQRELQNKFGYCNWNGLKEKINNYRLEPPGLFKGRGNHPKMGKLKKRIIPEQITINCSSDAIFPAPPAGHKWKAVHHNNNVTWLASWTENVNGMSKYISLNSSSKIKGQTDFQKYETARRLKRFIAEIRSNYMKDMRSTDTFKKQRAVILYFIDKFALRAGKEKGGNDSADTVGCCSLRCEHVKLYPQLNGKKHVVVLDFLGKDSIPYHNTIIVPSKIYANLSLFKQNKKESQKIFDLLTTIAVNRYLNSLMQGLTAKVFRTYNASMMLQNKLSKFTNSRCHSMSSKLLAYNRANREVALLCNHQRTPPKNFEEQVKNFKDKIKKKLLEIVTCKQQMIRAHAEGRRCQNGYKVKEFEGKKRKLKRLLDQLAKLKLNATNKVENKRVALGTSKVNYLDPRITVAWCIKNHVPIEKVYSKLQRAKFRWAIDCANKSFVF